VVAPAHPNRVRGNRAIMDNHNVRLHNWPPLARHAAFSRSISAVALAA
jgi:hypothetical protein